MQTARPRPVTLGDVIRDGNLKRCKCRSCKHDRGLDPTTLPGPLRRLAPADR